MQHCLHSSTTNSVFVLSTRWEITISQKGMEALGEENIHQLKSILVLKKADNSLSVFQNLSCICEKSHICMDVQKSSRLQGTCWDSQRCLLGHTEVCSREGTWTRSPDPQTSLIITSSSFFPFHCRGGHQELRHYTTLTFCVFEEELRSLQSDICYPRQLIALGCPLASSGQRLEKLLCTRQSETWRCG